MLLVSALEATVLSCILAVNKPHSIEEYGIDFDNQTGIALKGAKIGNAISEGVSVSSIYIQMGLDENDNYCLRFATAIAGDIYRFVYAFETTAEDQLIQLFTCSNSKNLDVTIQNLYVYLLGEGTASAPTGEVLSFGKIN